MNAATAPHASHRPTRRPLPEAMLAELRTQFGPRCSTATAVCEQHGRDESFYPVTPPDAVVFCESTGDVAAVVALAAVCVGIALVNRPARPA